MAIVTFIDAVRRTRQADEPLPAELWLVIEGSSLLLYGEGVAATSFLDRSAAMAHAACLAGEVPELGPYRVARYVLAPTERIATPTGTTDPLHGADGRN